VNVEGCICNHDLLSFLKEIAALEANGTSSARLSIVLAG
jgi:hypothetical protein